MSSVVLGRARRTGVALAIVGAFLLGGTATLARGNPDSVAPSGPTAVPAPMNVVPQGVAPAVLPTYVAGTRWLVINSSQAVAMTAIGGVMLTGTSGSVFFTYASTPAAAVVVPLDLPYGAVVWQIDVYGYRITPGSQSWYMIDNDDTTGVTVTTEASPLVLSGTGLLHGAVPLGAQLGLGHTWSVALLSSDANSGFVGVIVQYTVPFTNVVVPITPVRVFDSRFSSKLAQGAPRTINVKDAIDVSSGAVTAANAIPMGARGITFTLTVTATGNPGFVAILPGTTTTVTASTINWTAAGATVAAGGTVALGAGAAERQVTLVVGGGGSASTHVILDVTGYLVSES